MTTCRILCALDLSDASEDVLNEAVRLAGTGPNQLTLLHAIPPDEPFALEATDRHARLVALARTARAACADLEVVVLQGDPADVILRHAASAGVSLIVLGASRRPGAGHLRQGHVGERVAERAACATLVVSHAVLIPHP
jgi:nucleotide-binding universal stress UspA family protein